jgi:hypothetical protein
LRALSKKAEEENGVRSCFLLLLIQMQFERMHYTAGYPALFINGQASMAKSHPEDRKYLCRFHPCNEILMRLYEIIKTGKKQKTRPDPRIIFLSLGPLA